MSTRTGIGKTAGRVRTLALLIVAGIVLPLVMATAASAVTLRTSGSYPGTATTPKAILDQPYGGQSCGNGCFSIDSDVHVTSQSRTIYENPTYGAQWQYVCVTHRLRSWTPAISPGGLYLAGTWTLLQQSSACGYISPSGTSISDAGFRFDVMNRGTRLAVDVVVTWQLSNGTLLGMKTYDYTSAKDYTCSTWCATHSYADDGRVYYVIGY